METLVFPDGSTLTPARIAEMSINKTPQLLYPLQDQSVDEDASFMYRADAGTFADPDPTDRLTFSARRVDGTPLPEWLEC